MAVSEIRAVFSASAQKVWGIVTSLENYHINVGSLLWKTAI